MATLLLTLPLYHFHGEKVGWNSRDKEQVWGGMVWGASPKQRFAQTRGIYCEELQAEKERRGMDLLFLELPEVPEAGDFDMAMEEIRQAIQ